MLNISKYLEKIKRSINTDEDTKKIITESIKDISGISVDPTSVEIKDYVIFVRANLAICNKIFIYKSKILQDIKQKTSQKIVDIR